MTAMKCSPTNYVALAIVESDHDVFDASLKIAWFFNTLIALQGFGLIVAFMIFHVIGVILGGLLLLGLALYTFSRFTSYAQIASARDIAYAVYALAVMNKEYVGAPRLRSLLKAIPSSIFENAVACNYASSNIPQLFQEAREYSGISGDESRMPIYL